MLHSQVMWLLVLDIAEVQRDTALQIILCLKSTRHLINLAFSINMMLLWNIAFLLIDLYYLKKVDKIKELE